MEIFLDIGGMLFFLTVLTLLVKPLGTYMTNVYQGKRTFLSPVLVPLENLVYKAAGIKQEEMDWKDYAKALLLFNSLGFIVLFLILLLQGILPLNPHGFPGFPLDLAINTAISFVTNTNWQAYSGESAASYLTQTSGLAVQNFLSAATGMCIAIALIRGFTRHTSRTIGNFWQDMTKSVLYILLPIAIIAALLLVSQGVIQNFDPYTNSSLLQSFQTPDGRSINNQTLPMGPVASQEAIKEFGTNGGGFFNANSAHPFENPTPLTNFLEILLILLIPFSLTYTFGGFAGNTRQGWTLFTTMMMLFIVFLGAMYLSEYNGNPLVQKLGVNGSYMEGKEVRFGIGGSVIFAVSTTATSSGAVNTMHDSLTPTGGMVSNLLILLGEVIPGGVGSGLYTILAFAIIAVFIAGLMIGRTPEYLGKKIEVFEMWMSVLIVLTSGILVLIFVAVALVTYAGISSILNPGPHGLSEVLYAFASASNNNGSAFAGLNANTLFYNLLTAIAMLIGRFVPAVAALAMAGSLAKKKYIPPGIGTLPTHQMTFVLWLAVVILIVGALTFFPALSLGPIVEHMIMYAGQ